MSRCTTTSGSYRCEREACHAGPCEAQAPEYRTPAADPKRTATLEERVLVLEEQVASLQFVARRELPR